jgi:hypothetical protein
VTRIAYAHAKGERMFEHIQVVIMSAGQSCSQILGSWLSAYKLDWRYGSEVYGIDLARGQNINRFLEFDVPKGKTHLLCIDHDMIPLIETNKILTSPGDLIYCGYCGRMGSPGHYGDDDFGCACFRVSAKLLMTMQKPYFQTTVVDDVRTECECKYFLKKTQGAKMVGTIGHLQECILIPTPQTTNGWSLAWKKDLNASNS